MVGTITILGAGDMGHGIAELAALKGFQVRLRDIAPDVLEKARGKIQWSLEKLVAHGSATKEQAASAMERIKVTTDLKAALAGSDLVIEAVPESLELKKKVWAEVESMSGPATVFATNTSALCVHEIAAGLKDPSRLIGMHFFNPVLLLSLVEIIPGPQSRKESVDAVVETSRKLGKEPIVLSKDTPGFVTSRLVATWIGAAIAAGEQGIATPEQIDSSLKFRLAFPMGPFELADYTGLDVGDHVGHYLASRLGPQYAPLASLSKNVQEKKLGKKTGQGYYAWNGERVVATHNQELAKAFDPAIVMAITANEAARLVEAGVASAADVDRAMKLGCAFPKGPLEWADEQGLANVVTLLGRIRQQTGAALAEPAPLLAQKAASGGSFHEKISIEAAKPLYETVLVDVDEPTFVGTIQLNRPHRLHALNEELVRDLEAALDAMENDERVRAILLTATGEKAFCVGADLQEPVPPVQAVEAARRGHLLCIKMEKRSKPIVAGINGYAFGGGLELTLACDFRVAAKRAKLALPEVTLGLIPGMGGTQRLPKLIGLARAKEIVLLGERVDADTAAQYGLVNKVFENETFQQDARAYAAKVATRAPIALRLARQLLNAAPTTDISHGMEMEASSFGIAASTEDVLEGVGSLFMKKAPEFKGK